MINRYKGLIRDTWWLWLIFLVAAILLTSLVSLLFFVTFPILIFAVVYYGAVRYDDDGNAVGE